MRAHDHHDEPGRRASERGPGAEARGVGAPAAAIGRLDALTPDDVLELQRTVGNAGVSELVGRSPVLDVVGSGGGTPLDADTRADMEGRLGHDFGDVRIHTDARAQESAEAVSAHAYTVGAEVVFGRGQYDPSSAEGRKTLAHELTHVVQQRNGPVSGTPTGDGVAVSDPSDSFEREAVATAERVTGSQAPTEDRVVPQAAPVGAPCASVQSIAVQRHSSFEHTLLGNTPPSRLGDARIAPSQYMHLMEDLWNQTVFFGADPYKDPRDRFPEVRWIKLRGAGVWVSYGELNALADYLPDSQNIDELSARTVTPVLQRMRSGTSAKLLGFNFKGQASAGAWELLPQVATEKAINGATSALRDQQYFGLVSRNACHFAPYSWHRWARFHEEAADHASAYHRLAKVDTPVKDIDVRADEDLRQAWLKNGYGDHFLEDSFAAGHLVNKTLVMQWFVDYVNRKAPQWWDLVSPLMWSYTKPWYGLPDDHVMSAMGSRQQPKMAGQDLYRPPVDDGTSELDRDLGEGATDPQSAWERRSQSGRMAGSGVNATTSYTREQNYAAYLRFLNSSFLNLAAGETHNYFNERGLSVSNKRGNTLRVGGDDTLLSESDRGGASIAAEAVQMSQKAIADLVGTGSTGIDVGSIFDLVPTQVLVTVESETKRLGLEDWHGEVLKSICEKQIFPGVVASLNSKIARGGQPRLLSPALSNKQDQPPLPVEMGDFVLP